MRAAGALARGLAGGGRCGTGTGAAAPPVRAGAGGRGDGGADQTLAGRAGSGRAGTGAGLDMALDAGAGAAAEGARAGRPRRGRAGLPSAPAAGAEGAAGPGGGRWAEVMEQSKKRAVSAGWTSVRAIFHLIFNLPQTTHTTGAGNGGHCVCRHSPCRVCLTHVANQDPGISCCILQWGGRTAERHGSAQKGFSKGILKRNCPQPQWRALKQPRLWPGPGPGPVPAVPARP